MYIFTNTRCIRKYVGMEICRWVGRCVGMIRDVCDCVILCIIVLSKKQCVYKSFTNHRASFRCIPHISAHSFAPGGIPPSGRRGEVVVGPPASRWLESWHENMLKASRIHENSWKSMEVWSITNSWRKKDSAASVVRTRCMWHEKNIILLILPVWSIPSTTILGRCQRLWSASQEFHFFICSQELSIIMVIMFNDVSWCFMMLNLQ